MTIIDQITVHLPLIKAEEANCLMLGQLECRALISACKLIYQLELTIDELMTLTVVFMGLQIIPVHSTSLFAIAKVIHQKQDETLVV